MPKSEKAIVGGWFNKGGKKNNDRESREMEITWKERKNKRRKVEKITCHYYLSFSKLNSPMYTEGFSAGTSCKEPTCQCRRHETWV